METETLDPGTPTPTTSEQGPYTLRNQTNLPVPPSLRPDATLEGSLKRGRNGRPQQFTSRRPSNETPSKVPKAAEKSKAPKILLRVYVEDSCYDWVNRRADLAGYLRLSNLIQLDAVLHSPGMYVP